LALLTAALLATADVATRRLTAQEEASGAGRPGARELTGLRMLLVAPLLLAFAPAAGAPPGDAGFWWVVGLGAPLEVLALLCYMRAIGSGPLSLTLPLLALSPALLLLTGPLIAGEPWSLRGAPGVLLVVFGVWLLYAGEPGQAGSTGALRRLTSPLLALSRLPASRWMLAVAVIYAVTGALCKRGVNAVGAAPMAVYYFLAVALLVVPVVGPRGRSLARLVRLHPRLSLLVIVVFGLHLFAHMAALARIPVAEMVALKRTSVVMAAAAGILILKEEHAAFRLPGAIIMVAGAAWIALSG
jgi:drug/metabolite transporter (DMT)-like permease